MEDLDDIKYMFKLKEVERFKGFLNPDNRFESSAEHTWGSMILASYFLKKFKLKIDELKVLKILMYHDLIEIESGDTPLLDEEKIKDKPQKEKIAFEILKKKVPKKMLDEFVKLFEEYEDSKTTEAKFAQAIDKLEPMIQILNYKESWKAHGLDEKIVRLKKQNYMEPFPDLLNFFNKLIDFLRENDYIP